MNYFRLTPIAFVALIQSIHAAAAPAEPVLLDGRFLAEVKARVSRADEALRPALAALEAEAKQAVAMKPASVMDKGVAPPSGDKHDYMSQAPYWWPDPAKPDGRPYIRRDGNRNPEINRITDHDNLGRLGSAVSTLGLAFHLTGKSEYATAATRLVRVWFLDSATRMNAQLRFGQGIPGINDGRGIGIIETRGLPDLLDGVILIGPSPAWTTADEAGLQTWMRDYLTWLIESPYGQDEAKNGNNHETWYDVQVTALALYTGQADLAKRTVEHSRQRIATQIEPDGHQPKELERATSWDYSVFNLRAFFQLATLGDRVGEDLWNYHTNDGRSLRQALDFLTPYGAGDRKWTYEQSGNLKLADFHWLLRKAAVAWKEPQYRAMATKLGGASQRMDLTVP